MPPELGLERRRTHPAAAALSKNGSFNLCYLSVSLANPDSVALASSQQGFRQRRDVGQCPARGIGLVRADDRNVWLRPSWRLIVTDEPNSTTPDDEFLFLTWAVACLAIQ
jgi:hypothetical protein